MAGKAVWSLERRAESVKRGGGALEERDWARLTDVLTMLMLANARAVAMGLRRRVIDGEK
jgi:hypothetical protein